MNEMPIRKNYDSSESMKKTHVNIHLLMEIMWNVCASVIAISINISSRMLVFNGFSFYCGMIIV